jgi:hypothetical protein
MGNAYRHLHCPKLLQMKVQCVKGTLGFVEARHPLSQMPAILIVAQKQFCGVLFLQDP